MISYNPTSNRRDLFGNSQPLNPNNRKNIKDYSYSQADRIGKGFSSIVYKGTNDITSKTHPCMNFSCFPSSITNLS